MGYFKQLLLLNKLYTLVCSKIIIKVIKNLANVAGFCPLFVLRIINTYFFLEEFPMLRSAKL